MPITTIRLLLKFVVVFSEHLAEAKGSVAQRSWHYHAFLFLECIHLSIPKCYNQYLIIRYATI